MIPTMVEIARRMLEEGHKPGEIARELRVGGPSEIDYHGPTPQGSP
jgi:hypothetical protein